MKIIIVGCGWLGQQLAPVLSAAGYSLVATRRTAVACDTLSPAVDCQVLDLSQPVEMTAQLKQLFAGAVVLCAIAPGRQPGDNQYVQSLQHLAQLMQAAKSRAVIHFSSTGVYQGLDGVVNEATPLQLSLPRVQLLVAAEQALAQFTPCITLRLAGLMGPGRHPGRFAGGKTLADPQAPINMVHSADICRAVLSVLANDLQHGAVYNLACPQLMSRQAFYQDAATRCGTTVSFTAATSLQRQVDAQLFIRQFSFHYQFLSAADALSHCS